jgi:hypothetical protein
MSASHYSPAQQLAKGASILDRLSATLPVPDYGMVAR